MSMFTRDRIYSGLTIVGSAVFALLVAEILVRVVLPHGPKLPDRDVRLPDYKLGFTLIPNKDLLHDENGFKNEKALDQADIVALGDSHTYGIGGSLSSWPYFLASTTGLRVYNMGVGGYGPVQYYSLMDKALSLRPRYLVVGLLLGNDFFDAYNMVYNGHLLDRADYEYHDIPYNDESAWKDLRDPSFKDDVPQSASEFNHAKIPLESLRVFIRKHSRLYDLVAESTYVLRERLGLAKPHTIGTTDWTNTDPDVTLRYEESEGVKTIFWVGRRKVGVDINDKNIREGVRITKELLRAIKLKTDEAGVRLVVGIIPTKEAAYAPILGELIKASKDFVEVVENESALNREMLDFCEKEGITCVDVKPFMTLALREGKAVYPQSWDGHPNSLGYEYYAKALYTGIGSGRMVRQ